MREFICWINLFLKRSTDLLQISIRYRVITLSLFIENNWLNDNFIRPNNKIWRSGQFHENIREKKKVLDKFDFAIFIFILSLKLNWALKSLCLTYIAKSGQKKTYDICCYFYFWWLIRCILFIFYLPYLLIFLYDNTFCTILYVNR